jgi:hypothetical protein
LIDDWFRRHWPYLADCVRRGVEPERNRVEVLVITQEMWHPLARGVVWERTAAGFEPADFNATPFKQFNTDYLAQALAVYPDQELVSLVTKGAVTFSDAVGLSMIFGPHLRSLALGFDAVDTDIAEMIAAGKYSVSSRMRFFPCILLPQGATPKGTLGWRRTSDGGCPRAGKAPGFDPPILSLNDASRLSGGVPETKPNLAMVGRSLAILRYAAHVWGDHVYLLSDDFRAYFTQFFRHGSELWKSCFFWHHLGAPAWVVEYVLGFGLVPSSGIAQRFSHAIIWLLNARVEADMVRIFDEETIPVRCDYIAARRALGPDEARLHFAECYTDDTLIGVVGTQAFLCVAGHWGALKREIGVISAAQTKTAAGLCVLWNGIYINSYLGQLIVPPHKAVRAVAGLSLFSV